MSKAEKLVAELSAVCDAHSKLALAIADLIRHLQSVDTSPGPQEAVPVDEKKLQERMSPEKTEELRKALDALANQPPQYCECPALPDGFVGGFKTTTKGTVCLRCNRLIGERKSDTDDDQWVHAGNKRSYPRKLWDQMLDGQAPVCPPPKLPALYVCTYCGEVPVVKTTSEFGHAQVRCEHCGLAGPLFSCGEAALTANARAIHYWNRISMELGASK